MEKLLKYLYCKYNEIITEELDFNNLNNCILNENTVLKILKEGAKDKYDIENKIKIYDKKFVRKIMKEYLETSQSVELVFESNFEQSNSIFLIFDYLSLIVCDMPESFFCEKLKIEKIRFLQIVLSIVLYVLFQETYAMVGDKITKTQKKWLLGRDDFYFGVEDIKKVCWEIEQKDFDNFCNLYAIDLDNMYIELNNKNVQEGFYKYRDNYFILKIQKFLKYVLIKTEIMFKDFSVIRSFSEYQNKKGKTFENIVYDFVRGIYKTNVFHSLKYYPKSDKDCEIDIIIKQNKDLLIIECKSGVIDLHSEETDIAIKKKIFTKVKKAYKTLDDVHKYLQSNNCYCFSNKCNKLCGNNIEEVICLHLTMYPLDFISSNIHTLDVEEYLHKNGNPKITMSFEHFIAICLDCVEKNDDIFNYLKRRKEIIKENPKLRLDWNELDLYYQLSKKSSLLSNFLLNDNIEMNMITATFREEFGNEYSPAKKMVDKIDQIRLHKIFKTGKSIYSLNRRFLINLEEFMNLNGL